MMEIERNLVPQMTIEQFADKNNLIMEVHERSSMVGYQQKNTLPPIYANFKNVEVLADGGPIGTFGNGETEAEAIANYARAISEITIVVDARTNNRRQIQVPRLINQEAPDA